MESFHIAVNAVMPFVVYIAFGYLIQRIGIVDETTWDKLNRLVFYCFFPFLTFNSVYAVSEDYVFDWGFVLLCVLCDLAIILIVSILVPRFIVDRRKIPVVVQGIFRSNAVLFAIPLAINLFGDEAASLAGIVITIIVPVYNVVAVVLLEYYRGANISVPGLIKKILTNPLVDGAVIGILLHELHVVLPTWLMTPVRGIVNATTPLALIILGATLRFAAVRRNLRLVLPTTMIKLVGLPAIMLVFAKLLRMDPIHLFVFFTLFATPNAVSTFTMSAAMGADGELASHYVMISTVLSGFTLFLWIFFMKSVGLI